MTESISLDEAKRLVADNFSFVVPGSETNLDAMTKVGCRTDRQTMMPVGPPWLVRTGVHLREPSRELINRTMDKLGQLASERGFERQPQTPRDQFPEDATYQDERGFRVSTMILTNQGRQVLAIVSSSPPCVDD